jgi:hypothetical protein
MPESPKILPLNQIAKGPVRHEKLPPDLEARLRALWKSLGKDLMGSDSFEEVELNFCRDIDPEREIDIWERMEKLLQGWEAQQLSVSSTQRKKKWLELLSTSPQLIIQKRNCEIVRFRPISDPE